MKSKNSKAMLIIFITKVARKKKILLLNCGLGKCKCNFTMFSEFKILPGGPGGRVSNCLKSCTSGN